MLKFINLGLILLLSAKNGIDTKDVEDPGCIQFTLDNSPDTSWETTKLRLVGKNDYHASYSPPDGETLQTQYCFNADTNKDGDVLIVGVYGLNSDNMAEISWSAIDSEGMLYKGSYMTFMTFMFHVQGDLYWTTLKESHNLEYSEKSDNVNDFANNSQPDGTYTESDAMPSYDTSPDTSTNSFSEENQEATTEAEAAGQQLIKTTTILTDNTKAGTESSTNTHYNQQKWKLQGSISLCGYTEEMTKEQASLVSSVIVDTLNAASVEADVGENDVSIMFWESIASPNEISDSTISHKVIFIAYIDPVSFGYNTDNMNEDELARHIETYIQASIDSGMFLAELEDLALGSHVGSFCGIKAAGITSKMSRNYVTSSPNYDIEESSLSAEILFYAIIASLVTIALLLVAISRRLVALKASNSAIKESASSDDVSKHDGEDNLFTNNDAKVETGTVHSLVTDKERRFVKPAHTNQQPVIASTTNLHSFMASKKNINPYTPYSIDFETTM